MEKPVIADSDEQRIFLVFSVPNQFSSLLLIQSCTEEWKKKSFFLSQFPRDVLFPPRKLNVAIPLQTMGVHSLAQQLTLGKAGKKFQLWVALGPVGVHCTLWSCQPFTVCSPAFHSLLSRSLALLRVLPTDFSPTSSDSRSFWNTFVFCSRAELSV